jgi:hypothetical protein
MNLNILSKHSSARACIYGRRLALGASEGLPDVRASGDPIGWAPRADSRPLSSSVAVCGMYFPLAPLARCGARKIASRECASPLFSWLNGGLSRRGVDVAFNAPQVPGFFHCGSPWRRALARARAINPTELDREEGRAGAAASVAQHKGRAEMAAR